MPPPYPPPPGYPSQPGNPPPKQGMGCFAKGCITVLVLLALLVAAGGGGTWYVWHNLTAFISTTPLKIRTYPATDEQYQEVLGRYDAFIASVNAGEAATLSLSADDLNILIAKDPEEKDLRGKAYVSIVNNEVIAELCFPQDKASSGPVAYYGGKAYGTASYANDTASVTINKVETMDGHPAPSLAQFVIKYFGDAFIKTFNEGRREKRRKDPSFDEFLTKLRTVSIQDNRIVATAVAGQPSAHPLGTPPPATDATSAAEPAATPEASASPESTP